MKLIYLVVVELNSTSHPIFKETRGTAEIHEQSEEKCSLSCN
jgi:hypothetical protein